MSSDSTLLNFYEKASRQQINLQKTVASFSPSEVQDMVINFFDIRRVEGHFKYLGVSTLIEKSKNKHFQILKERVWSKLSRWKENMLSKSSKRILIKVVV